MKYTGKLRSAVALEILQAAVANSAREFLKYTHRTGGWLLREMRDFSYCMPNLICPSRMVYALMFTAVPQQIPSTLMHKAS